MERHYNKESEEVRFISHLQMTTYIYSPILAYLEITKSRLTNEYWTSMITEDYAKVARGHKYKSPSSPKKQSSELVDIVVTQAKDLSLEWPIN